MAARRITRKEMKRDEFVTAMGRITEWMEENARQVLFIGGGLVAVAILSVFVWQYLAQREAKASLLLARGVEMFHAGVEGIEGSGRPDGPAYASPEEKYRAVLDQMDALIQTYPRSQAGRLALYYKGMVLTHLSKPKDAVAALQGFLSSSPRSFAAPMARAALARALADAGEPQKALEEYEQLSRGEGAYPPDAALFEMGICLEKMGKKDDAKRVYERITREFPNSEYSQEAQERLKKVS